jgi:hypothetical protein
MTMLDIFTKQAKEFANKRLILSHQPQGEQRVKWWVSIHANKSQHEPHNHIGYAVSGAYYSKVPQGSGMFCFTDPTGQREQRGKEMKRGELVIFPSYAEHAVSKSTNIEPRVSFSLNWAEMMDLSKGQFRSFLSPRR